LSSRDKDKKELFHFTLFKECCKDLPSNGQIEHSDNPDFLYKHSKGTLGIEHTQLFKETTNPRKEYSPQAIEIFKQDIVNYAQKCCEIDAPNLYVRVWFNFNLTVPKNRRLQVEKIGLSLAEVIKKWHRENPSEFHAFLKLPQIPSTFLSISITRVKTLYKWILNEAAHQENFPIEKIQSRIDEKNLLYKKYREKCGECWLLIVVNIFKNSQSFEMPDQIDHKFNSKFERIYYMDSSHRKDLKELSINRI
jgi:hypothetical protein